MQQLILKNDIEKAKLDALLFFLKSWDIEAELKIDSIIEKKKSKFSLAAGIWKDYNLDSKALRDNAWNRNK